ncbi:Hypothetical_protein [Hexamita inflata]|uniref:Hypothetical_protein n=1 Tax=Hexamita inflata TaxID=28002 RepID=A0AA86R4I2_9EUKA|nr:Hypothetical protein HINF_LOCUS56383 [Hexamita inflata]
MLPSNKPTFLFASDLITAVVQALKVPSKPSRLQWQNCTESSKSPLKTALQSLFRTANATIWKPRFAKKSPKAEAKSWKTRSQRFSCRLMRKAGPSVDATALFRQLESSTSRMEKVTIWYSESWTMAEQVSAYWKASPELRSTKQQEVEKTSSSTRGRKGRKRARWRKWEFWQATFLARTWKTPQNCTTAPETSGTAKAGMKVKRSTSLPSVWANSTAAVSTQNWTAKKEKPWASSRPKRPSARSSFREARAKYSYGRWNCFFLFTM